MAKPNPILGHGYDAVFNRGEKSVNKAANLFGIEIEMEGWPQEGGLQVDSKPWWNPVPDASLRNGMEFVSAKPTKFEDLPQAFDHLAKAFKAAKFTPVFTYRTSVHVHVNAKDMTYRDLISMYILWSIIENAAIDFGGPERKGNVHCLPSADSTEVVDTLRTFILADPEQTNPLGIMQRICSRERRYAAFNWAAFSQHGTIEFRTHRGTFDKDQLLSWVNILSDLKASAMKVTNPQEIISDFSSLGIQGWLRKYVPNAPNRFAALFIQQQVFAFKAMRLMQELAYARNDWETYNRKERKPKVSPQKNITAEEAVAGAMNAFEAAVQRNVEGVNIRWVAAPPNRTLAVHRRYNTWRRNNGFPELGTDEWIRLNYPITREMFIEQQEFGRI